MRYNPPPNWPAPPEGWRPPLGWQPPVEWGPPPPGWSVWVAEPIPSSNGPVAIAVATALVTAVLLGIAAGRSGEDGAAVGSYVFGTLIVPAMIIGVVWTRGLAHVSRWWIVPTTVGSALVLLALHGSG